MRISTSQFYSKNTQNIIDRQSNVNQSVINISDGKRVITAADDSVAASAIFNLKQEQALTEQYQSNIDYADNKINAAESMIETAENLMFKVHDLVMQGGNGAHDDADRAVLANELEGNFEQLLSLANSRDEAGDYIFGGFQNQSPPFGRQSDGSVLYSGDQGQRLTNIGPGIQVATNDSGDKVFMSIANTVGDFLPSYNLNPAFADSGRASVTSADISDRAGYVPVANPDDYTINFSENPASGAMELVVNDSLGAQVYPASSYQAGQVVAFNGIEVVIEQQPQDGDSITITPDQDIDIFGAISDAINWLREPADSGSENALHALEYGHILNNIDAAKTKLGNVRSEIGARLSLTEAQLERHLDYEITVESSRGKLEDLDMVEAISLFEQQKLALQASQAAFSKVQNMSLLNYL